jgi:Adenylate and Guanylate cyclase catalytic domain
MDFYAVLDQVLDLLRQRGRVTYRALKRQSDLDDAVLEDLKAEIIEAHLLAVDAEGKMLVWTGDTAPVPSPAAVQAPPPERPPLDYTPTHLAEKILTARASLEGERKQVTVFFVDIKDSTKLIEGLDPEAAQQLLDPAIHLMMDAVHRFDGTVNQVLGDGIMALFGAPIAHEDHALRASYAALALAETLGMLPLQAHCHLGLGTLYAKIDQREPARAELSAAIDLYRAIEMTFWLPQAEAAQAWVT